MSRIKVMDESLARLIAAGEVIERPASVVKELVENAIDAGAKNISVEVERAGAKLIAVSDDGCGMDEEDAALALELHGTSKLLDADGIRSIATMGFRGEALPSIAQVSRMSLVTRTAGNAAGIELQIEAAKIVQKNPAGCRVGTTISVRDLFFNTPARKKFLKSAATEEMHIEECLSLLAIGSCQVGFELRMDGRFVFRLPPGTLESRIRELFGREYAANLLKVEAKEGIMSFSGYIGVPGFTRSSRKEQRIFVNHRPVESAAVVRGIREGYATLAEPGRFPPALLFIELPPEEIDVNVHPAKREIRFRSEYGVTQAVAAAVSAALRVHGAGAEEEVIEAEEKPEPVSLNQNEQKFVPTPPPEIPAAERRMPISGKVPLKYLMEGAKISYNPKPVEPDLDFVPPQSDCRLTDRNFAGPENLPQPVSPQLRGFWPESIIGIFDATYILAEAPDGLVLIDQHAAHERVMFERLLDSWKQKSVDSQGLLLPETLELPRMQAGFLLNNAAFFRNLGFDFSEAGGTTVMINAIPAVLKNRRPAGEFIADMLQMLIEENGNAPAERDLETIARAACHAAVKAHDELSESDALKLIEQLKKCRQGTLCPHGRPTIIKLTRNEIEKRFGRR